MNYKQNKQRQKLISTLTFLIHLSGGDINLSRLNLLDYKYNMQDTKDWPIYTIFMHGLRYPDVITVPNNVWIISNCDDISMYTAGKKPIRLLNWIFNNSNENNKTIQERFQILLNKEKEKGKDTWANYFCVNVPGTKIFNMSFAVGIKKTYIENFKEYPVFKDLYQLDTMGIYKPDQLQPVDLKSIDINEYNVLQKQTNLLKNENFELYLKSEQEWDKLQILNKEFKKIEKRINIYDKTIEKMRKDINKILRKKRFIKIINQYQDTINKINNIWNDIKIFKEMDNDESDKFINKSVQLRKLNTIIETFRKKKNNEPIIIFIGLACTPFENYRTETIIKKENLEKFLNIDNDEDKIMPPIPNLTVSSTKLHQEKFCGRGRPRLDEFINSDNLYMTERKLTPKINKQINLCKSLLFHKFFVGGTIIFKPFQNEKDLTNFTALIIGFDNSQDEPRIKIEISDKIKEKLDKIYKHVVSDQQLHKENKQKIKFINVLLYNDKIQTSIHNVYSISKYFLEKYFIPTSGSTLISKIDSEDRIKKTQKKMLSSLDDLSSDSESEELTIKPKPWYKKIYKKMFGY